MSAGTAPVTNPGTTGRGTTGRRTRTLDPTARGDRRLTPVGVIIDALAVIALGLAAASPLAASYGGWRWALAVGGGLALGVATALVSRLGHLGPWFTTGILALVYLVAGPALAVPDRVAAGLVPTPDALRTLGTGLIDAWRDSLTLIPPLGSAGNVLIVPLVIGLLGGLLAGLALWRTRRPESAALVVLAILAAGIAFGVADGADASVRGLVIAVVMLVWLRWRAMSGARAIWVRRIALATGTVAAVAAAAAGLTSITDDLQREVLRDHVQPPFDPRDYPSPLAKFRAYSDQLNLKNTELFEVDGVDSGTYVRVATMDYYDGIVWNVTGGAGSGDASGTFVRFRDTPSGGDLSEVSVTITAFSGVWVPSIGDPRGVTVLDADGEVDAERATTVLRNEVTGTVAQVGGVKPGTTYEFETVIPETHPAEVITDAAREQGVSLEQPAEVPEALTKLVDTWIGDAGGGGADGALAQLIAQRFKDDGYYSDGKPSGYTSAAGHGLSRITDLVAQPRAMVGNDEQYAAALGVALQNLSVPARVVIGAEVPAGGTVRGDDMHAWVEVALNGLGWVPLYPTPPDDQILREQQDEPDPVPQPYLPQPPEVPTEPDQADHAPPQGAGQETEFDLWGFLLFLLGIAYTALKIFLLLSPIWGLLLVKYLRRRRRRRASDPVVRLSGGWREVTDRARDFGVRLPISNTRHQNGIVLHGRFPEANAPWLASVADRHVFAPGEPSASDVDAYWADVQTALTRMRTTLPWWRRWIAVLSPASIPWRSSLHRLGVWVRGLAASTRRLMPTRRAHDSSNFTGARRRRKASTKGTPS